MNFIYRDFSGKLGETLDKMERMRYNDKVRSVKMEENAPWNGCETFPIRWD